MERCVKCRLGTYQEPGSSDRTDGIIPNDFEIWWISFGETESSICPMIFYGIPTLPGIFVYIYIYILLPVSIYILIYTQLCIHYDLHLCISYPENPEKCWTYRPPNFVSIIHFILSVNWRYLFTSGPSIPKKNSFCSIDVVIESRLRKVARQLAGHYLSHESRANTNTCQEIDTSAA